MSAHHAQIDGSDLTSPAQVPLRLPSDVMRLERMGSFFPTRLSFMRSLVRRLAREHCQVRRPIWEICDEGYGRAVYTVELGGFTYSLIGFATPLADDARTDRVIAEAWDTTFVLYDGVPDENELTRLEENVPLQEAGRFCEKDLVLSRANKSVRLFTHVVERLSAGLQPDPGLVQSIGYLMRTTAVYGNGKFGIADREIVADRPGLEGPFQVELLTVWLIRGFTLDLVEHVARRRSPAHAESLATNFKRFLGIGNATGLGMAPFLVSHPILLNNWMVVRETALARVCAIETAAQDKAERTLALLDRARRHVADWYTDDARQAARIETLSEELAEIDRLVTPAWWQRSHPWRSLVEISQGYSLECQEFIVALVMEAHGELVDGLGDCMASVTRPNIDPRTPLARLDDIVKDVYGWALAIDLENPEATRQFWYVSEEKLEPRLGDRTREDGAELALPLDIVVRIHALAKDLRTALADDNGQSVGDFLQKRPEHRYVVRRAQAAERHPYAEIHDNLTDASCLAIDMLRCKLSFFGAVRFDPKSDRWTRITMFQGAPLATELDAGDIDEIDDWWLPVLESE